MGIKNNKLFAKNNLVIYEHTIMGLEELNSYIMVGLTDTAGH